MIVVPENAVLNCYQALSSRPAVTNRGRVPRGGIWGRSKRAADVGKVLINDLVVRGIIGVNEASATVPQEIVINLDLFTDLSRAGATDDIADCVDYQTVAEKVTAHAETARRFTVEALAADIARIGLAEPGVERVRPGGEARMPFVACRSVGVEIERARAIERGSIASWSARPRSKTTSERPPSPPVYRGACELMSIEPPDLGGLLPAAEPNTWRAWAWAPTSTRPGTSSGPSSGCASAVAVEAVSTAWESPAVGSDGPTTSTPPCWSARRCRRRRLTATAQGDRSTSSAGCAHRDQAAAG